MVFTYLGAFFEEVLLIHAGSQLLKSSILAENGCILFETILKSGRVGKTKLMGGRGEKTGETSYITGVAKCEGYIHFYERYEHSDIVHQHSKKVHLSETIYSVYEI